MNAVVAYKNVSAIIPNWVDASGFALNQIPSNLRKWMSVTGSMTEKLREYAPDIHVNLLFHDWQVPLDAESKYLNITHKESCIVREAILKTAKTNCIYARCIFPNTLLQGKFKTLKTLGSQFVGDTVFKYPQLKRGTFQFAHITPDHIYYAKIKQHVWLQKTQLWGRRSIFHLPHASFLVTEIFLHEFS